MPSFEDEEVEAEANDKALIGRDSGMGDLDDVGMGDMGILTKMIKIDNAFEYMRERKQPGWQSTLNEAIDTQIGGRIAAGIFPIPGPAVAPRSLGHEFALTLAENPATPNMLYGLTNLIINFANAKLTDDQIQRGFDALIPGNPDDVKQLPQGSDPASPQQQPVNPGPGGAPGTSKQIDVMTLNPNDQAECFRIMKQTVIGKQLTTPEGAAHLVMALQAEERGVRGPAAPSSVKHDPNVAPLTSPEQEQVVQPLPQQGFPVKDQYQMIMGAIGGIAKDTKEALDGITSRVLASEKEAEDRYKKIDNIVSRLEADDKTDLESVDTQILAEGLKDDEKVEADQPRCEYTKPDETQCRLSAVGGSQYCGIHRKIMET